MVVGNRRLARENAELRRVNEVMRTVSAIMKYLQCEELTIT
jgi:hypothetical protein